MATPSTDRRTAVAVVLDGHGDQTLMGGKGAALDRLVGWGLPVPPTALITIDAYRRFEARPPVQAVVDQVRAGTALSADEIDAAFLATPLDEGDAATIVAVAREVAGDGLLAVRSSATIEDLERSSFAGQYRSLLEVDADDPEAVSVAVRLVFASLWHPAPCEYRRSFGIDDRSAAMAAVLMRMVAAERAGVVFTVDPGGDLASARIESVEGLAESLVSGAETPTAVLLPRAAPRPGVSPELGEVLDLALRVEHLAGCPQDVEWAWDGTNVWLVQARPITVPSGEVGDGFDDDPALLEGIDLTTSGIGEMLPGVLPPLVWVISASLVEEALRRLLDDLAVLPADLVGPRALVRRVRGRAALDFGRLQDMAQALPGSASEQLEQEYFGSRRRGREAAPSAPRAIGRVRSAGHDLRVLRVQRRYAVDASTTIRATASIVADRPDLTAMADAALVSYHLRLLDLALRGMSAELGVAAQAAATYRRLQLLLSRHLGDVGAGRGAEAAVASGGVTAAVPDIASAAVFAGPTWQELGRRPPEPPTRTVPDQGDGEGDLAADGAGVEGVVDALRASAGWDDSSVFAHLRLRAVRRLARETTKQLRQRETTKVALLTLGGEVRRVHLEAGRRLVATGRLEDPADIDLLSPTELRAALRSGPMVTPDVIALRRRMLVRYGQDGPLPPRFTGMPEREEVSAPIGRRLEGWGASGGRFRGVVQVVRSPADPLAPGAVLVAEATDPSWSPLFVRAGAIVLDRGGPLSHAAILARELGVPAVLNLPGATTLLAGHEVTVDGDAGVVIIHDLEEDT